MGEPPFRPAESIGPEVIERIARFAIHRAARVRAVTTLSGRSINPVLSVELDGGPSIILKIRHGVGHSPFWAEAYQLQYLAEKQILPVPRVLAHGSDGANGPYTYLILERLPGIQWAAAQASLTSSQWRLLQEELGTLIGTLHREVTADAFGDVLPESSRPSGSWADFFSRMWRDRIQELLNSDRLDPPTLEAVAWIHGNLPRLLDSNDAPRLVHGNLGPTKILCAERKGQGERWGVSGILDPALLFAHCEVELAGLELLEAADDVFLASYRKQKPLAEGYDLRKRIYMLYTVLDQVRLYGDTHYILNAMDRVRDLLRQCG